MEGVASSLPGSAWGRRSGGSASCFSRSLRQSLWISVPRLEPGNQLKPVKFNSTQVLAVESQTKDELPDVSALFLNCLLLHLLLLFLTRPTALAPLDLVVYPNGYSTDILYSSVSINSKPLFQFLLNFELVIIVFKSFFMISRKFGVS